MLERATLDGRFTHSNPLVGRYSSHFQEAGDADSRAQSEKNVFMGKALRSNLELPNIEQASFR